MQDLPSTPRVGTAPCCHGWGNEAGITYQDNPPGQQIPARYQFAAMSGGRSSMETLCPLEATSSSFPGFLLLRAFPADCCAGWDYGLILAPSGEISVVHAVPPPGWRDVLSAATLQWGQFLSPSQIAVVVFLLPQIQLTVPRSSYPSLEQGEGCQIDWPFFSWWKQWLK